MKKKENTKEKLKIGLYKVVFKKDFDIDDADYIGLTISLSRDLQALINNLCLDNTTKGKYNNGEKEISFKRYKTKNWLYTSLNDTARDIIFSKDLMDSGEYKLEMFNISYLENVIDALKRAFKRLIEAVLSANAQELNVKYNPRKGNSKHPWETQAREYTDMLRDSHHVLTSD